jgi:dTDP-4-amino-4,6-dideoxygalactose transaminase
VIPYLDLKAQYRRIKPEVDAALGRVVESAQFVLGEDVAAFEEEFAAYCGVDLAVAVNSGTSALHVALLAAGVGPEHEVITVPFTFVGTAAAVRYAGGHPVFVDIDPETFTLDPERLESAITARTRAIVPVHLYGQPAAMDPILEIARRRGLAVIEDAAQAHGAEDRGRRVGGLGDLGCFSFYPGKNLGAYGEGGILVTDDPEHARTARALRDWGQERRDQHLLLGFNYRMDALQGAVLRVKLRHLERWTEERSDRAQRYHKLLEGSGFGVQAVRRDARHVFHVFAIRSPDRDALQESLSRRGITTRVHYPTPIHLQPAFADLGHAPGDFPHAEQLAREVLSLPLYPEMPEAHQEEVVDALRSFSDDAGRSR